MDLKETYNKIAGGWCLDHQNDDWWVEGTDKFTSLLDSDDLVLDVGCAGGTKSRYLTQKGFQVVGIDFSEKMIEIAKREIPEARFQVLELADVDKLENIFDGIFMQAVLLHVPKIEVKKKLTKIANKLKKGGYFYIAVKERRTDGPEEEIKIENDYGYSYQRFFSYFTLDEIKRYFVDLGLNIVYEDVSSVGKTNWIEVIAKKGKEAGSYGLV